MLTSYLNEVSLKAPIVHSITNYVTVNDCANALLAIGASPIMADDLGEVCDIVKISNSLVINTGTLNSRTLESMLCAGVCANENGIPVVLDPVGAGASTLRNESVIKLLNNIQFSAIRGNISEIRAIAKGHGTTRGVDADLRDAIDEQNLDGAILFAKELAKKLDTVIAISGAIDLVSDKDITYVIRNGHPIMTRITGSGCMSTAVMGAFIGASPSSPLKAAASTVCTMGLCGELAAKKSCSTGTFRTLLIDELSTINETILAGGASYEIR